MLCLISRLTVRGEGVFVLRSERLVTNQISTTNKRVIINRALGRLRTVCQLFIFGERGKNVPVHRRGQQMQRMQHEKRVGSYCDVFVGLGTNGPKKNNEREGRAGLRLLMSVPEVGSGGTAPG